MKYRLIILFFFLISFFKVHFSFGQQSAESLSPSVLSKPEPSPKAMPPEGAFKDPTRLALEKLPRRATLRSVFLPGFGQITNKRWWKVPIIYAGFVYFFLEYQSNQQQYASLLREAQYRKLNPGLSENPAYDGYAEIEDIIEAKDLYRTNMEICILSMVGIYLANVLDAYVDAKFFRFDISNNLSLQIRPTLNVFPTEKVFAMLSPAIKINLLL